MQAGTFVTVRDVGQAVGRLEGEFLVDFHAESDFLNVRVNAAWYRDFRFKYSWIGI